MNFIRSGSLVAAWMFWHSIAAAQIVDPSPIYNPYSDQSPFKLLEVPEDPIVYYKTYTQAEALHSAKKWAEAEPLLERLVAVYDRDPRAWRMLADAKSNLGKHLEAATAFERAGALIGWDLEFSNGYRAAAAYYAAGNREKALEILRQMVFERHSIARASMMEAPSLAPLREDPEFLKIIGRQDTTGWTREEGWKYDLDHLYDELKRVNPDYRDKPFPAEFEQRYQQLKRNVPNLSDEEIFVGMQRMLAVLHQGHVILWAGNEARTPNRQLPLRLYVFPEGIFIIDAAPGYEHLIGSRVRSIGRLSAEDALRRVAQAHSRDGDMEFLVAVSRLGESYFLKGIGATDTSESVNLDLEVPGGRTMTVSLPMMPASRPNRKLSPPPEVETPLFLGRMDEMHWTQPLPEYRALYVQVNNLVDDQDESLPQFGERLWSMLQAQKPKNLILDLRHNNGGTTQSYPQLLRTLTAFSRTAGNRLYVLIGRETYSAAGNLVTDLERLADPVFVGEATSQCCNLYGDATYVILPYSRVQGELTAVKWQLSSPGDRRREMSPEVPVQLTANAYFAGEDTALQTILQLIESK